MFDVPRAPQDDASASLHPRESDGEEVLVVETEEDLAAALDGDRPFLAPPEIAERFGLLADLEEDVGDPEDFLPPLAEEDADGEEA